MQNRPRPEPTDRAKVLAALGERPQLAAVDDVGPPGQNCGTDSDNQPIPETPKGDETNIA